MPENNDDVAILEAKLESLKSKGPFVVIFDCESDSTFRLTPGIDRSAKFFRMQCTIVCAIVIECAKCATMSANNVQDRELTKLHFWRTQRPNNEAPFEGLFQIFDQAEVIVAYNGLEFDFPLLFKHYESRPRYMAHRLKCLDPFIRLRAATEVWFKLDTLLKHNGLPAKSGDGLEAITMYGHGKFDELKKYCEDDVMLLTKFVLLPTVKLPDMGTIPPSLTNLNAAVSNAQFLPLSDDGFVVL